MYMPVRDPEYYKESSGTEALRIRDSTFITRILWL